MWDDVFLGMSTNYTYKPDGTNREDDISQTGQERFKGWLGYPCLTRRAVMESHAHGLDLLNNRYPNCTATA